jgi:hypothetical protein
MHIAGINWVAVLVAAAAYFAIGFVIHMRLVDLKAWDAAKHVDQAKLSKTRMACGMVLPLATAVGLAVLFSWGVMSPAWPKASNGDSSSPSHRDFRCSGTTGSTARHRSGYSRSTASIS